MKRVSLAVAGLAILAFGFAHAAEQQRSTYRYGASEVCRDLDFYESLKPTVPILLRLNQKQAESWRGVESALDVVNVGTSAVRAGPHPQASGESRRPRQWRRPGRRRQMT
jgi:hypothetical protein